MKMHLNTILRLSLVMAVLTIFPGMVSAEEFSSKGADSCLGCHKSEKWGVMPIFDTKHGALTDPDAPFSNLQCEGCHGPSNAHARAKKKSETPVARNFGENSLNSVPEQNEACLGCHTDHNMGWFGSRHESVDVGCASCHTIHENSDPVFDPMTQQEMCFQ